ncbi:DUF4197 domain-containing protein [Thiovibrio frasassiensis]|uniref:DUF4197 domain-containing protein n=1 Tax=Thiovibrio frasassiensis TaxID=2984131 RepID=A0A9X4RPE8_9BACT|nr:DUF4197 domain-containing protein [Thiovibrio frasassiensis]MDG4475177.1 DUF4197 domain-containing protein [Thiovibrio frasassiensis]
MKKSLYLIGVALTLFAFSAEYAQAETSWLEKGAGMLNTLNTTTTQKTGGTPSNAEIGSAFKEALNLGTKKVVGQLGATDGFNTDPAIHIPLPRELQTVKTVLAKIGMSQAIDDLELKLNRAAEAATPKAKALFLQAIKEMTFEDIKRIYAGPEDSATRYFQAKMTPSLKKEMQPIIDTSLSQVGAVQSYDQVMGQYKAVPFVPDVKANLTDHVLQKAMDGIFYYLAKEEASIRKDPLKQTTALLKKVFGGN